MISIHAPREGGDYGVIPAAVDTVYINFNDIKRGTMDISIHAPREGGDEHPAASASMRVISIHAPREGGD